MKKLLALGIISIAAFIGGCQPASETIKGFTSPPVEVEQPRITCDASACRPVVAVMNFEIKAGHEAKRELAEGLNDMLINSLVETQCFRVVERSRRNEILGEIGLGLDGMIDPASAPKVGNLTGAQLLVMGAVTEFAERESGGLGGILSPLLTGVGVVSAHVGLIVRVVDATTGEILMSKSIDKKIKKVGLVAGGSLFGVPMGGALFKSKAMQDAVEEALIETVALLASQKERVPCVSSSANNQQKQKLTPSACSLASPTGPRMMVVIPEIHLRRPVPDPAGETEIIRKFLEMGFNLVDPKQVAAIRDQEKVLNAVKNPQAAAALGAEFGADIIIIGEAFSEFAKQEGSMISCRARVEAKAIQTSTGRILSANGMEAGGADIAEFVAGKAALRNAGSQLADYFITQLCQNASLDQAQNSSVELLLTNVNFRQAQRFASFLETLPGVQHVQKQLTGNTARIHAQYHESAERLADAMTAGNRSGLLFEITNLAVNKIDIAVTGEGTVQPEKALNEKEMIREIQASLMKLGYDPGIADGVMGQKTLSAIRQYQQDADLPIDGNPSLSLLESLKSHLR